MVYTYHNIEVTFSPFTKDIATLYCDYINKLFKAQLFN